MLIELVKEECNLTKKTYFQNWFNALRRTSDSAKTLLEHYGHHRAHKPRKAIYYTHYLLKTLRITTYSLYILHCIYFWYNFHIVYILLRCQPTKKSFVPRLTKLSQVFNSHFLMVLVFATCKFLLDQALVWILWNWLEFMWEFWVIALGSTPTFLQSDIVPSSLCLIPSSIRYNSVLFFALLTSWSNYAERVYFCNFVLKSSQACPKCSRGFSLPLRKRRLTIFHYPCRHTTSC